MGLTSSGGARPCGGQLGPSMHAAPGGAGVTWRSKARAGSSRHGTSGAGSNSVAPTGLTYAGSGRIEWGRGRGWLARRHGVVGWSRGAGAASSCGRAEERATLRSTTPSDSKSGLEDMFLRAMMSINLATQDLTRQRFVSLICWVTPPRQTLARDAQCSGDESRNRSVPSSLARCLPDLQSLQPCQGLEHLLFFT
ncbi:unnamed protein product [Urochloa humidicola]